MQQITMLTALLLLILAVSTSITVSVDTSDSAVSNLVQDSIMPLEDGEVTRSRRGAVLPRMFKYLSNVIQKTMPKLRNVKMSARPRRPRKPPRRGPNHPGIPFPEPEKPIIRPPMPYPGIPRRTPSKPYPYGPPRPKYKIPA